MKLLTNKGMLLVGILSIIFITFISSCGGGSAPVPTGSNATICSPNLPPDMQKLLGCQPQQSPSSPVSECSANEIQVILSVENYGLGSPVPGATISVFTSTSNKILNQTPDITLTAGSSATATACLPVNTPFAVKASASGFVDTCEFGEVVSPADANQTKTVQLMSNSIVSMASGSAGVTQDPAKGAIVGTISDTSGNPVSGDTIAFLNIDTNQTVTSGIFYGAPPLGLPDPKLTETSSAGVYLGFNVPPGAYYVQVSTAGTSITITQAYGEAITGSVSIVNIQQP